VVTEPAPSANPGAPNRSAVARHLRPLVGLAVAVLVVGYFLLTGLIARHQLERASDDVDRVKTALLDDDHAAAQRWMAQAQHDARSARSWVAGPAWSVVAHIPWLGRPARVEKGVASVAVELSERALPPAVVAGEQLSPKRFRRADGTIRLAGFDAAAPSLAAAVSATSAAEQSLRDLPSSTWLPTANHAVKRARTLVEQLGGRLADASDAARLAPTMLGNDGPRRYLVVVQNDAEARGLGGIPGALAILTTSHGRLSVGDFESNEYLTESPGPITGVPKDYRDTYAPSDVLTNFPDSDVSPDFPVVARVWLAFWKKQTGEDLDGVVTTDPAALSYLLDVTGPATLPDGTKVSGENFVSLSEQQVYAQVQSRSAREAYFIQLAKAVADRVANARGDAEAMVKAMNRAVNEHRLMVWSANASEQRVLAATPLAGALPATTAPFVGVTVNNGQGSKLDYYLDRSVTYDRGACIANNMQQSTVTVRLHNDAPSSLPRYVTLRLGDTRGNPLGSERLFVALYTTTGASLVGVSDADGKLFATAGSEAGHTRYETDVTIERGATTTLVFHLIEPRSDRPVVIWRQPGVRDESVDLAGGACG
jgi:hypothetical protein